VIKICESRGKGGNELYVQEIMPQDSAIKRKKKGGQGVLLGVGTWFYEETWGGCR